MLVFYNQLGGNWTGVLDLQHLKISVVYTFPQQSEMSLMQNWEEMYTIVSSIPLGRILGLPLPTVVRRPHMSQKSRWKALRSLEDNFQALPFASEKSLFSPTLPTHLTWIPCASLSKITYEVMVSFVHKPILPLNTEPILYFRTPSSYQSTWAKQTHKECLVNKSLLDGHQH